MTRYERKRFFEQLMTLRAAYRADAHVATDLTIDGLLAAVEQMFNDAVIIEPATVTTNPATTNGATTAD